MQVERFSFREFNDGAPGKPVIKSHGHKSKKDAPAVPPPPPTFSEEQLKAAERDAYKKGFLEGTAEGRKQAETEQAAVERALTVTVEKFAASVAPLFAAYRKMALEINANVPKTALAIARKVADKALSENAEPLICEVAIRACETLAAEPKLAITVHESLADALTARLEQMGSRLPPNTAIVVLRDPAMPLADCRVEWQHGSLERDTGKLWQQIERVVADMTVTAKRDTEEQLTTLQAQMPQEKG